MTFLQKLTLTAVRLYIHGLARVSPARAAARAFALFCTPRRRKRHPVPALFQQAEPLTLEVAGYQLKGYRWHRGAARRALVLHGFESSVINFGAYVSVLAEKGYEVLAIDAPAHGRSEGSRITAPLYRDMILTIQEQLGPVQFFVAHSFGGLALALALEQMPPDPNRRVVLLAPATETSTALQQFYALLRIRNERFKREMDALIRRQEGHGPEWYSIRRAARNIRDPLLWIHDEQDELTPWLDALRVREENHPNLHFVLTRGLGHRRIYRDPGVIRQAGAFLT